MFLSNGSLVIKTPIVPGDSSWFTSMPPMSAHGWPSAYSAIYRQQLWVYVVVNKLASGVARLPLPVYKRDDMNRPRADDHPMAKLLANPNPGMSAFDLWFWTSATRDVFGEAFWLKQRVRGTVVGLYPLHPASMRCEDGGSWTFDNGKTRIDDIAASDLVHFKHFNPDSTSRGMSPLEPLRLTLENEWHAREATGSFWKNGGRPGATLTHPRRLSPTAAAQLKERFDAVTSGSGKNGSTLVLEEGMKFEPYTLTAEEAQYIETRKLNREEVCGAYDVPPPAVHILDHATFSNITEQLRSVYRDTQAPRCKSFEATIELDLRRAEWPNDDVYAEFLMDDVLRGDFETRQAALHAADYMTVAEKRRIENLPFIEGTDRIFMNAATLPLDALDAQADAIVAQTEATRAETDTAPPALPPAPESQEYLPVSVGRTVLGRLGWQRDVAEVDVKALTKGLSDEFTGRVLACTATASTVVEMRDRIRSLSKAG